MKIRILKSTDIDSVFNIFKETWLDTYPNKDFGITKEQIIKIYESKERYENIKKYISNFSDKKIGYGIEINGKLVGIGTTNMIGEKCYIGAIYILAEYQKKGFGKILLDKLLEFRKDFKEIYLEVGVYNENAINFYEKNGFKIIKGSENKYKIIDDIYIPTIMMKKIINKLNIMILEKPEIKHKKMYEKLIKEWGNIEKIPTSPTRLFCGENFEDFLNEVTNDINNNTKGVNASLFFLVDNKDIIGAIQIRHSINHPNLIENSGHIGYGVSPKYRRKGYASKMLELGLIEAKKIGLKEVLITCDTENIGSKKVIEKNGGIFERLTKDGKKYRFIINLE